ncbi:MAG: hypothetical protein FWF76_02590, partial [Oscillospiraceae bacterium]|nr:hypothetical protein [Oscillospiraceae bacterium]
FVFLFYDIFSPFHFIISRKPQTCPVKYNRFTIRKALLSVTGERSSMYGRGNLRKMSYNQNASVTGLE